MTICTNFTDSLPNITQPPLTQQTPKKKTLDKGEEEKPYTQYWLN